MYDCFDDSFFQEQQKRLDEADIEFDVTNLCGCTELEILWTVNLLIKEKEVSSHVAV